MRKLLTLLFILVFSINGLCDPIVIGSEAKSRATTVAGYTMIVLENPSDADGILDTIKLYVSNNNAGNITIATFYNVSGTNYSTRDYCILGAMTTGLNTITQDKDGNPIALEVKAGDYIGCNVQNWGDGTIYYDDSGGVGLRYSAAGNIPCTNQNFGILAGYSISLYAEGETEGGEPEPEILKIGKYNTASTSNISKWNGAVTSGTPIDNSSYLSPDNHSSDWTNGANGIDGNTNTNTTRSVTRRSWSSYYTVSLTNPITSDKVRVWTHSSISTSYFTDHEVDYYDGTSWTNIGSGAISKNQWVVYPLGGEKTLSQVRVRYYNTNSSSRTCYLGEIEVYKIDATPGGSMLLWNTYEWEN